MVQACVVGDLCDPGGYLGLKSKTLQIPIDFDENILAEIFPVSHVMNHSEYHMRHEPLILKDKFFEGGLISRLDSIDQFTGFCFILICHVSIIYDR